MSISSLVPMAFVESVTRSIAFYEKLGFVEGNTHTPEGGGEPDVAAFRSKLLEAGVDGGPVRHPFYAPRGEFRVTDPDGYALMVSHT